MTNFIVYSYFILCTYIVVYLQVELVYVTYMGRFILVYTYLSQKYQHSNIKSYLYLWLLCFT